MNALDQLELLKEACSELFSLQERLTDWGVDLVNDYSIEKLEEALESLRENLHEVVEQEYHTIVFVNKECHPAYARGIDRKDFPKSTVKYHVEQLKRDGCEIIGYHNISRDTFESINPKYTCMEVYKMSTEDWDSMNAREVR